MLRILVVFGTRPEAIKLAPVIDRLRCTDETKKEVTVTVALTGQHRDMVGPILKYFEIIPDFDLNIMRDGQTPLGVVERTLQRIEPLLRQNEFDRIIVQGDTSSALAAALAGFYARIPVAHVEAGLRSGKVNDPFPEEMNRQLISRLADLHFAPTEGNRENLLNEGIPSEQIHVVGNTVIDALHRIVNHPDEGVLRRIAGIIESFRDHRLLLLTTHRRENFGERQKGIFSAVRQLLEKHEDIALLFPVHPNPSVREAVEKHLPSHPRMKLIDPLDYITFVHLMNRVDLILTDSGGIQEEAPALGVPVLVLRETTEREEGLLAGGTMLVGTEADAIVEGADVLLREKNERRGRYPFGREGATEKIVELLCR